MKIYVASSWRNDHYPNVVKLLIEAGHEVYDFRNPPSGNHGFKWTEIDSNYHEWSPEAFKCYINHPLAEAQFRNDLTAMASCDACVLVLPCGRSAHTEAGWFAGAGKKVYVYIPISQEAELMYKLFDGICTSEEDLLTSING